MTNETKLRRPLFTFGLLHALSRAGGRARSADAIASVADLVPLNARELSRNKSGDVRWMVAVERASGRLVNAGWLTKSGDGVWVLTPEGAAALASMTPEEAHHEVLRLDRLG